jgi:threonine/homoserine/homoserine lactone efflux protein
MELLVTAFAVLAAIGIGAISPGPSLVLVARTAIAISRRDGLATALGMGIGGLVFASAALLGLHVVLTNVPWAYLAIKIAGAAYLLYLAVCLWKGARDPIAASDVRADDAHGLLRSFVFGLATQLSNPKTAIWYASIFTAFLSPEQPRGLAIVILPMIFMIEAGWYALVAVAFSSAGPRRGYLRLKPWIDRTAGSVMGLLGLKLIWDSR